MKYKSDTELGNDEWFKHGLNLRGQHVDCIGKMSQYAVLGEYYFQFVRVATKEEIKTHCK